MLPGFFHVERNSEILQILQILALVVAVIQVTPVEEGYEFSTPPSLTHLSLVNHYLEHFASWRTRPR